VTVSVSGSLAAIALQQVHRVDRNRVAVNALGVEVHGDPPVLYQLREPVVMK